MTTFEIVAKLAELNPLYDNDMGETPCFFCSEIDGHADDCIWIAAKKSIEAYKLMRSYIDSINNRGR